MMKKTNEVQVSRQGLTTCQGCKCHIKIDTTVAATACPFCGYQMATQEPAALQALSRRGLTRRGRSLLAAALLGTSVVLSAAPIGCSMYGMPPLNEAILATDQIANSIFFDYPEVGEAQGQTFVLYNKGDRELTVSVLRLADANDGIFKLIDPPATPFSLPPGKDNGKKITIQFLPSSEDLFSARLEIVSTNATNVDENSKFSIRVQHRVKFSDPVWNCGGNLDFGSVTPGTSASKECTLTNRGKADLMITSVSYTKEKGGDNVDFKWDLPTTPMTVKAGESVPIKIDYTPSDTQPLEDQGELVLDVKDNHPESEQKLKLQLKGNQ